MSEAPYTCKCCGRAVIVVANGSCGGPRIIRACRCGDSAPVIANMRAVVKGHASLESP